MSEENGIYIALGEAYEFAENTCLARRTRLPSRTLTT